jgi:hypothetical protein
MAADGNSTLKKSVKKLARTLLATTCLTVASAGAGLAGTVDESVFGEFSKSSSSPTILPTGTDTVLGSLSSTGIDGIDFVKFINLIGGSTFDLTATDTSGASIQILSDTPSTIVPLTFFSSGSPFDSGPFIIPGDGNLIVGIGSNEGSSNYALTLTDPQGAPEPGTFGAVGLALAGALAWRRKRNA